MHNVGLVLLCFAFVCAVIATCFAQTLGRFHMGWAAVSFWIAAQLLGGLAPVFR